MFTLERIKSVLAAQTYVRHAMRNVYKRASVALCLRDNGGVIELLMIKRAERIGDTWSGQMAFPGGRMDPEDVNSFAAAMRECDEELGIDIAPYTHFLCRLHDVQALGGGRQLPLLVSPFILSMHTMPEFKPNHEVAEIVWIPLEYFRRVGNRNYFEMNHKGIDYALPCYMYRGYRVWGMSLRMIEELLNRLD